MKSIKAHCIKCHKFGKLDKLGGHCRVCRKKARDKPQANNTFKGVFG